MSVFLYRKADQAAHVEIREWNFRVQDDIVKLKVNQINFNKRKKTFFTENKFQQQLMRAPNLSFWDLLCRQTLSRAGGLPYGSYTLIKSEGKTGRS